MLTVSCPTCNAQLHAKDQYAGRPVRCPHCGMISRLPEKADPVPAVDATPVICAVCSREVPGGPDQVVDTNGSFYHRGCYEEACRAVEQSRGGSPEWVASGEVPGGQRAIATLGTSSALSLQQRSAPALRIWIGVGIAAPVLMVLLMVLHAIFSSGTRPSSGNSAGRQSSGSQSSGSQSSGSQSSGSRSSGNQSSGNQSSGAVARKVPAVQRDAGRSERLTEARRSFATMLHGLPFPKTPAPTPPADIFRRIQYEASVGPLTAYLSVDPADGRKHPAIIWITGGDCNSIDDGCWTAAPVNNDQSARAFREAGIVMMFPSLRGGNDNPGVREGFWGEVDDTMAAAEYLVQQPYVDPERIYLGGHSTGGTLVLLVAESSSRFRAVFSFGPLDKLDGYPPQYLPFNTSNRREIELRSPIYWLHCVASPVFVFEGTSNGNIVCLHRMAKASSNPQIHFFPVSGADHFSLLDPVTRLVAAKILGDREATTNIAFTEDELNRGVAR